MVQLRRSSLLNSGHQTVRECSSSKHSACSHGRAEYAWLKPKLALLLSTPLFSCTSLLFLSFFSRVLRLAYALPAFRFLRIVRLPCFCSLDFSLFLSVSFVLSCRRMLCSAGRSLLECLSAPWQKIQLAGSGVTTKFALVSSSAIISRGRRIGSLKP